MRSAKPPTLTNQTSTSSQNKFNSTSTEVTEGRARLKAIPANELDRNATRATPKLARRALQMVCRLLAYNAQPDLARRLNTYLADPDEYRAITRNLSHLGGTIHYRRKTITVTLDQPHPPRVAKALGLLIDELDTNSPRLPADHRPINYRLTD